MLQLVNIWLSLLFDTNNTGHFISINVRFARLGCITTVTLCYVQQNPICVTVASWQNLGIYVNAHKFTRLGKAVVRGMAVVRGHQIPCSRDKRQ